MSQKAVLHVDLDAFFASVEVLDNPALKGKPVIVGGLPGDRRSVVSTCSYEARAYGVHSAMPTARAYELCPDGIFLHGRMARYHEKSREVMEIFQHYSPDVRQMSVDEAFIDITGTERLFGTPEQTARKIKAEVLEKTGLTVSVGAASNKYIAKIASGLSKPDGLYCVPPGFEEKFMLSLPLDKLWGIGTKTRMRLNGCGIYTIQDIHAISETALCQLFGQATGTFLYNAVRGHEVENFGEETKSHSLSAERTFSFDLADDFTIETELMHLSYDVMFRLLHEKYNSRTVCLKIRYEDFTTVSVSETSTRAVSSIEDLFERSCRLLQKKYERGRGIRLLGLALHNLEKGTEPAQGELFDFGEKKQRAVEQTVLKLHQKNPSTKLKKARQFIQNTIVMLLLLFPALRLNAQQAASLQKEIQFETEGSWETVLSDTATFSGTGNALRFSPGTPAIIQKADASVQFRYDDSCYFAAEVTDNIEQSTVAAGYDGDGTVRSVRIGNDIAGTYASPGVKASFSGSGWDAGFSIHVDSVQTKSKTWTGTSEKATSFIPLSSYQSGRMYALPDPASTASVKGLYVEQEGGAYTDSDGRTYTKLSQDQYLLLPGQCAIFLVTPVTGALLAETDDASSLPQALCPFLKDVYQLFGDRGEESLYTLMGINVHDTQAGPDATETVSLFTALTGNGLTSPATCLYISRPGTFSPFQVASLYESSASEQAALLSVSASSLSAGFTTLPVQDLLKSFIRLYASSADTRTGGFQKAIDRFPAAKAYPWTYVPSSGKTQSDAVPDILITSAGASDTCSIGTQAIENTIHAYRNNTPEPVSYDRNTGTVSFSHPIAQNDTVTVYWNEYSKDVSGTALTFAADGSLHFSPFISVSAWIEGQFFLNGSSITSGQRETSPSISTGSDIVWSRQFGNHSVTARNLLQVSADLHSLTPVIPLLSFDGSGTVALWLTETASATTIRTSGITGYVVPASFTLQSEGSRNDSGTIEIKLPSNASVLSSASEFSFQMNVPTQTHAYYDVYLQLGNGSLWRISATQAEPADEGVLKAFDKSRNSLVQTVTVKLTDADRLQLAASQDMKLVVKNRSATPLSLTAEISGSSRGAAGISTAITAWTSSGKQVAANASVQEIQPPAPLPADSGVQDSTSVQHVLNVSWAPEDAGTAAVLKAERAVSPLTLSAFRTVSVYLYVPAESSATDVTVNLLKTDTDGYTAVKSISIPESELVAHKGSWYKASSSIQQDDTVTALEILMNARPSGTNPVSLYVGGIYLSDPVSSALLNDTASIRTDYSGDNLSASLSARLSGRTALYADTGADTSATSLISDAAFSVQSAYVAVDGTGQFNLTSSSLQNASLSLRSGDELLPSILSFSMDALYTRNSRLLQKGSLSLSLEPFEIPFKADMSLSNETKGSATVTRTTATLSSRYDAGTTTVAVILDKNCRNPSSSSRKEELGVTQSFTLFGDLFSPSASLSADTTSDARTSQNEGGFVEELILPFTVAGNRFNVSWVRRTRSQFTAEKRQSYSDDISAFMCNLKPFSALLTQMPVADLFSETLAGTLRNEASSGNATSLLSYSSTYAFSWSRSITGTLTDMLVPSSTALSVERKLSSAGFNTAETLSASASAGFNSFNCFGAYADTPVFSWFNQDEYQLSTKITYADRKLKSEVSCYAGLYLPDDGVVNSYYTGSFSSDSFIHKIQLSLIQFTEAKSTDGKTVSGQKTQHSSSGSFAVSGKSTSALTTWSIGAAHTSRFPVSDSFSVSAAASLDARISDSIRLTATASVGGKLTF